MTLKPSELIDAVIKLDSSPQLIDSAKTIDQLHEHVTKVDPRLALVKGARLEGVGITFFVMQVTLGGHVVAEFNVLDAMDPEEIDPSGEAKREFSFGEVNDAIAHGIRTLGDRIQADKMRTGTNRQVLGVLGQE